MSPIAPILRSVEIRVQLLRHRGWDPIRHPDMSPPLATTPMPRPVAAVAPPVHRRADAASWIEERLETLQDIEALRASHPMMDAVIEEVDGRMIRVGEHWLADFASCNYLGFDLDPEIIAAIPAYLERWGT